MGDKLSVEMGGEKAVRKFFLFEYLKNLKEKRAFGSGDFVTTIEGEFAGQNLMVVEKLASGMVKIAPAPNMPIVELYESKLFHFEDFHDAYREALNKYPFSREELEK